MRTNTNNNGQQKLDRADVHQARIWRRQGKSVSWIVNHFSVSRNEMRERINSHASSCRGPELAWEVTWQRVLAAHQRKSKTKADITARRSHNRATDERRAKNRQ